MPSPSLLDLHDLSRDVVTFIYDDVGARHVGQTSSEVREWRSVQGRAIMTRLRAREAKTLASMMERVHADSVMDLTFVSCFCSPKEAKELAKLIPGQMKTFKFLIGSNIKRIRSEGVIAIAQALPASLDSLKLLLNSNMVGDDGVVALAEAMPPNLERLEIALQSNEMSSTSFTALANSLPQSLDHLELGLGGNHLGNDGLAALAKAMPPKLTTLMIGAQRIQAGEQGVGALVNGIPESVRTFRVMLSENYFGSAGIDALAQGIAKLQFESLTIALGSNGIGSTDVETLARSLPPTLKDVKLLLRLDQVGDEGCRAIADNLPAGVEHLEVGLEYVGLTDDGIKDLVARLPSGLKSLALRLSQNDVNDDGAFAIADALKNMKGLESLCLGLDGTDVGDDGMNEIVASLPETLTSLSVQSNCYGYPNLMGLECALEHKRQIESSAAPVSGVRCVDERRKTEVGDKKVLVF